MPIKSFSKCGFSGVVKEFVGSYGAALQVTTVDEDGRHEL
jgi:hypothetical protein